MPRHAAAAAVTFVLLLVGSLPSAYAQTRSTVRASVRSDGTPGGANSLTRLGLAISATGRYVAFDSFANNLVAGDTNGLADVFVHDTQTGVTVRVSVTSGGAQATGGLSDWPSISANGRFVAFVSGASNLVAGDSNFVEDIFVHDRDIDADDVFDEAGAIATTRVSVATGGVQVFARSDRPFISADGRYVAFISSASALVTGDTNGVDDVFLHDRQTGTTERVSLKPGDAQSFGNSTFATLSEDGRYVAFAAAGDKDSTDHVYIRDRGFGTTALVSRSTAGVAGNGNSYAPWISRDGRFIAFHSLASNLSTAPDVDTNGFADIFVHDRGSGEVGGEPSTTRISRASNGSEAEDEVGLGSLFASISANGRLVSFSSFATNLVGDDTNGTWDVFVHDRATEQTLRSSVASDDTQQASAEGSLQSFSMAPISSDGRFVAFGSLAPNLVTDDTTPFQDVFLHDRLAWRVALLSGTGAGTLGNPTQLEPSVSGDGRFAAFSSSGSQIVPGDTNLRSDVFVRTRLTNDVRRVSVSTAGAEANGDSVRPSVSSTGRFIAFASDATNLVSSDTNGVRDVFLHDRDVDGDGVLDEAGATATLRVSVNAQGLQVGGTSDRPAISGDGRYIAFASTAIDLVPGDTNGARDIFVADRTTGVVVRVSVAGNGTQADGASDQPSISGSGRFVTFSSAATVLVGNDTNGAIDVFVHDRDTDVDGVFDEPGAVSTTRISRSTAGIAGDAKSDAPSISRDGRFVAFASLATNLVGGDTNGFSDVFLHDRQTGQTERLSVPTTGAQGNGASDSPVASDGAALVAFRSSASNMVPNDTNGVPDIFVRNRAISQTTRVSVLRDGAQGEGPSYAPSISGDGSRIVYATTSLGGGISKPQDVIGDDSTGAVGARAPAPSLAAITPDRGPPAGGTSVTITGTSFDDVQEVRIGGAVLQNFRKVDGGTITGVTPARAAGSYDIEVLSVTSSFLATLTSLSRAFTYEDVVPCTFSLSQTAIDAAAAGGANTVTVTAGAGCDWTATPQADWLSLTSPARGTGNGPVQFTVAANTDPASRTGTLSVNDRTLTVSQAGAPVVCTIRLAPAATTLPSTGGAASVDVITPSTCNWSAASNAAFITLTGPTAGTGTGISAFTVTPNPGAAARSGTLTVSGVTFTVTQDAPPPAPCSYSVTPLAQSVVAGGARHSVTVTAGADCSWSASSGASFITIAGGASGTGNGAVTYDVAANQTTAVRDGTLVVAGQTVNVSQAGVGCTYSVSPTSRTVPAAGGDFTAGVTAPAGCAWSAASPVSWITIVSTGSGIGTSAVTYRVAANQSGAVRSASLTVASQTVVVTQEVSTDSDGDGLPDTWENFFGLDQESAEGDDGAAGDPDRDSRTNLQEFNGGTHPRGFFTRYLPEGATGGFFDMFVALANVDTTFAASVQLRFLRADGGLSTQAVALPPRSRRTVNAEDVGGLAAAEFSTVIESDLPVVADRTMRWDATGYGSHAETSIASPALLWYLAEGATHSGFDLFYLVQNASSSDASIEITYLRSAPLAPVVRPYVIPANARHTIWVDTEGPALANHNLSAVIRSTNNVPISVERAMYLNVPGQTFGAGHDSAGITEPKTSWFLAEGATGEYFDLFILVANPSGTDAAIQARFLLEDGTVITKQYTAAANSRLNIFVDDEDPRLANAAVSTTITSTNGVPVIVERAMWWPGPTPSTWSEAHNSAGATATGTMWAMAEGEVGGAFQTETYILLANTSPAAAPVRVTLLFEDGTAPVSKTFSVNPNARFNVNAAAEFPAAAGRRFGAIVESLGAVPAQIVVERAMYSNSLGVIWAAGTNALATRIQ